MFAWYILYTIIIHPFIDPTFCLEKLI